MAHYTCIRLVAGLGSAHDWRGAFPWRCDCTRLSAGRTDGTRLAHVTTRNHGGRDDGPRVGDHPAGAALPDQNATVVIGEGVEKETWLVVSGAVGLHRSMCNTPTGVISLKMQR